MKSAFSTILQRTVERVPGAVGAIFADWDGEAVDLISPTGRNNRDHLLHIGAHYAVILNNVQAVLRLFHFGEAIEIVLQHEQIDFLVRAVGDGYYVVLALGKDGHLATALRETRACADGLRKEMY